MYTYLKGHFAYAFILRDTLLLYLNLWAHCVCIYLKRDTRLVPFPNEKCFFTKSELFLSFKRVFVLISKF